ncbi:MULTISPECIES: TadE/TadG family type IV pilus assembly protein [unclassified Afipia]|uniref:TadE/TadG family type IV pilus assembly protein n=1 Tax=unclassified Afipia TaxID=2642050 RepID=UPI000412A317|nr:MULTISPECIES: TadE/TadG family type IV pilus assembly protein [unclassified Afipia]
MPHPATSMTAINKALRRFRRDRRASAATEFAFVAPIFFVLLFAVMETAMVFFAAQILETGTQNSARLMLTHQAQDAGMTQAQFKQDLCDRISVMFSCDGIYVDVKSFAEGATVNITDPIDGSGNFVNNFSYQTTPAGSAATVVVRAFYQWPMFVTGLGYNIANIGRNTSNSKRLLAATAAFRVEP